MEYAMPCLNRKGEPHQHTHARRPHLGDIVEKVDGSGTIVAVVIQPHPDSEYASWGWWFVRIISDPWWNSYAYLGWHESQMTVLDCVEVRHTQVTPERVTAHRAGL